MSINLFPTEKNSCDVCVWDVMVGGGISPAYSHVQFNLHQTFKHTTEPITERTGLSKRVHINNIDKWFEIQ